MEIKVRYNIILCQSRWNLVEQDKDAQETRCLVPHFLPYILQQPEGKSVADMGHMGHILWEMGILLLDIVHAGMADILPLPSDI